MKIAIFTLDSDLICPFFKANKFLVFERDNPNWNIVRETSFEPIAPTSLPALRTAVGALLPLIADCEILAGGALSGIAFSIFNCAGLHIFEIEAINEAVLDGMVDDVVSADTAQNIKEEIVRNARPVLTGTDGIYFLDLVLLQTECPEVSSKKAMKDFFDDTPFLELHLVCRHIPPWIENEGRLQIDARSKGRNVYAIIRRQC
ncbi:hypothetical protein LQZ18_18155 [Lachnospiraceae bacterium ZAX-1]